MSYSGASNPPWQRNTLGNTGGQQQMQTTAAMQSPATGMHYPNQAPIYGQNMGMSQQGQQGQNVGVAPYNMNQMPAAAAPMFQAVSYPTQAARGNLNPVAFPSSQQQPPQQAPNNYNAVGVVTKVHNDCGFVDDEVFFHKNVCKGAVPKIGDRVLVEASFNQNSPFKWNATRIQIVPSTGSTGSNSVPRAPPPPVLSTNSSTNSGYNAVPPPGEYAGQFGRSTTRRASPPPPPRRISPPRSASRKDGKHGRDDNDNGNDKKRSRVEEELYHRILEKLEARDEDPRNCALTIDRISLSKAYGGSISETGKIENTQTMSLESNLPHAGERRLSKRELRKRTAKQLPLENMAKELDLQNMAHSKPLSRRQQKRAKKKAVYEKKKAAGPTGAFKAPKKALVVRICMSDGNPIDTPRKKFFDNHLCEMSEKSTVSYRFDKVHNSCGMMYFRCSDERTKEWFTSAVVPSAPKYQGAKFTIVNLIRTVISILERINKPKDVIKRFKVQYPGITPKNWKILTCKQYPLVQENRVQTLLVVDIDQASADYLKWALESRDHGSCWRVKINYPK